MKSVYHETFESGPGPWTCGKDKADGVWHKNINGHRGAPFPLKWSKTGGRRGPYVSSEGPWYFDDNHGEFAWLYLAFFVDRSELAGLKGADLREAEVTVSLRGRNMMLNGTRLLFWIQGMAEAHNWALASQPIADSLLDGEWHEHKVILHNDERQWKTMGVTRFDGKIRVVQSLSVSEGYLDRILRGEHVNFGFLLCGVNPYCLPTGSMDFEEVRISVPS